MGCYVSSNFKFGMQSTDNNLERLIISAKLYMLLGMKVCRDSNSPLWAAENAPISLLVEEFQIQHMQKILHSETMCHFR